LLGGASTLAFPLPRGSELPPYTECSALAGGWMWRMALAHRTGCGYAYSSAHVEPEAAVEALLARAGLRRARSADPRLVTWKVGRRTACWVGNCVAIGASAGFVEPLEATGLHLVQRSIELLLEHLPDAGFADEQRRTYNGAMAELLDAVRDFTILHYQLSGRPEPFWRDARAVPLPESIVELLDAYDAKGEIPARATGVFSEASHYFVLAGGNRLPRVRLADPAALGEAREVLSRIDGQNMVIAAAMPRHSELIAFINRPAAGVGLDGLGVPNASWR
jgi:tryptophan 7-halogenase